MASLAYIAQAATTADGLKCADGPGAVEPIHLFCIPEIHLLGNDVVQILVCAN